MDLFDLGKDRKLFHYASKKYKDHTFRDYMGDKDSYYIKQCEQSRLKFNFAAFFFTFPWLIYRRLYKHAAILFFIVLLRFVFDDFQGIINHEYPVLSRIIYNIILGTSLFWGYTGNRLYLRKFCKDMKKGYVPEERKVFKNRMSMVLFSILLFLAISMSLSNILINIQKKYQKVFLQPDGDGYFGHGVEVCKTGNGEYYVLLNSGREQLKFLGRPYSPEKSYIYRITKEGKIQESYIVPSLSTHIPREDNLFFEHEGRLYITYVEKETKKEFVGVLEDNRLIELKSFPLEIKRMAMGKEGLYVRNEKGVRSDILYEQTGEETLYIFNEERSLYFKGDKLFFKDTQRGVDIDTGLENNDPYIRYLTDDIITLTYPGYDFIVFNSETGLHGAIAKDESVFFSDRMVIGDTLYRLENRYNEKSLNTTIGISAFSLTGELLWKKEYPFLRSYSSSYPGFVKNSNEIEISGSIRRGTPVFFLSRFTKEGELITFSE